MAYTTKTLIQNFTGVTYSSDLNTWITDVIAGVQEWIDAYVGSTFENSASTTRYYDGEGTAKLVVGDVQSVSALLILGPSGETTMTLTADTDYVLAPYNESTKNTIVLMRGGQLSAFPRLRRSVAVTGVFGRSTVPKRVEVVATQLAASIIQDGLRGGKVSSETLGSYSRSFAVIDQKAEAMGVYNTLDQYRDVGL